MDFRNRVGANKGGGAPASETDIALERRERLRKLALETVDLTKDPYFRRNHLGMYECQLCLTLHNNEGSYLAHTQGKKHQINLKRRYEDQERAAVKSQEPMNSDSVQEWKNKWLKSQKATYNIVHGIPEYSMTKVYCQTRDCYGYLIRADFPQINDNEAPTYRFMGAYEQNVEDNRGKYQYVVIAAPGYQPISFRVPSELQILQTKDTLMDYWDSLRRSYFLHFLCPQRVLQPLPAIPQRPIQTQLTLYGAGGYFS